MAIDYSLRPTGNGNSQRGSCLSYAWGSQGAILLHTDGCNSTTHTQIPGTTDLFDYSDVYGFEL